MAWNLLNSVRQECFKRRVSMAYYEYECEKCGHIFTVKQSFEEHDQQPKPKCPQCQSRKVAQLIGSVHLKTGKKS